jgi:hypothetical protein
MTRRRRGRQEEVVASGDLGQGKRVTGGRGQAARHIAATAAARGDDDVWCRRGNVGVRWREEMTATTRAAVTGEDLVRGQRRRGTVWVRRESLASKITHR